MGGAVAKRKQEAKEARRPKPTLLITKADWDRLPKGQKRRRADGTRHIKQHSGKQHVWICVHWTH